MASTPAEIAEKAIALHRKYRGKLSIESRMPLNTAEDLALAYTPGVGHVSSAVAANPDLAYELTGRGRTVAVVSDGSAVLGLGNLGALGAMPVMEGKCVLFKELGGVEHEVIPDRIEAATYAIAGVATKGEVTLKGARPDRRARRRRWRCCRRNLPGWGSSPAIMAAGSRMSRWSKSPPRTCLRCALAVEKLPSPPPMARKW